MAMEKVKMLGAVVGDIIGSTYEFHNTKSMGFELFEEVIRLAISLGGDSDTIGAMAGAIAACVYLIPDEIAERCNNILTEDLRDIKDRFCELIEKRNICWILDM